MLFHVLLPVVTVPMGYYPSNSISPGYPHFHNTD
jgi:hypothetical protein